MKRNSEISADTARNALMKLCSGKEMCSFDLARKMDLWGILKNDQERILSYLKKENFFSDTRYSTAFINDKSRFQKWGRLKIKYALMAKCIPEDLIESILHETEEPVYSQNLHDLLSKKMRTLRETESSQQKKARLYRYALGKGYEPEMILRVLQSVCP